MAPAGEMWSVVTESPKMPRARAPVISAGCCRAHAEVREERRLLDVGGLRVPLVNVARGGRDLVPLRILRGEVRVELAEDLGLERGLHRRRALPAASARCPSGKRVARPCRCRGSAAQVDVHAAGEREGDDERGRHEEVRLDVLVDAGLEVAVAGEHGGGDEIVLHHGVLDAARRAGRSCRCRSCSRSRRSGSRACRGRAGGRSC
jgi:hypothetical protein